MQWDIQLGRTDMYGHEWHKEQCDCALGNITCKMGNTWGQNLNTKFVYHKVLDYSIGHSPSETYH